MKNVRGSGMPMIGGLIRWSEIQRGELEHTLALAGPSNRMKSSPSSPTRQELCGPMAARNDGWMDGWKVLMGYLRGNVFS